jgi:putative FmdB family regulatory protein
MPTYEYHCDACEHNFDEFQSMSEATLTKCPKCGKKKLRRVFGTGAAILFKGSGFYETDYRSESYKSAAKKDQEGPAKSSGDAGGTSGGSAGESGSSGASGGEGGKGKTKSPKSEG